MPVTIDGSSPIGELLHKAARLRIEQRSNWDRHIK
jgi:hypothetical protein